MNIDNYAENQKATTRPRETYKYMLLYAVSSSQTALRTAVPAEISFAACSNCAVCNKEISLPLNLHVIMYNLKQNLQYTTTLFSCKYIVSSRSV